MALSEKVALVLSIYGAVLSTVNAIVAYWKDRADVVLNVRSNMKSAFEGRYAGMTLTIVTATNRGKRPVSVQGFAAKQFDSSKQLWFTDTRPNLPCELTESQSVSAYIDQSAGSLDRVESYYVWDSVGRHFWFSKAKWPHRLVAQFRRKFKI